MAHILIIEDQEPLGILYKSILRKYNHETTFTTTGDAGIEEALRDKPHLVILLPGIPRD